MRDFKDLGADVDALPQQKAERSPGKRTLTDGQHRASGSNDPATPGKRTLTERLPPSRSSLPEPVVSVLADEQGVPLSQPGRWSSRIGADVGHARIVTTPGSAAAAAALGTRAFTVGHRVFFGSGTDSASDGGAILAHELTHVAQQRGVPEPESYDDVPITPGHDAREHAANREDGTQLAGSGLSVSMFGDGSAVTWPYFLDGMGIELELRDMWEQLRVNERGPFGKYLAHLYSFARVVKEHLLVEHMKPRLQEMIAPEPLGPLIDRARAIDYDQPDENKAAVKTDKGSNRSHEQTVLVEIGNALARHFHESVGRMFPRAVALMAARNPPPTVSAPSPSWMDLPEEAVAVSHPMDVIVRKALLSSPHDLWGVSNSAVLSGDVSTEIGDALAPEDAATVTFAPEGKLWHWVKADPPKATKEQVATALFGKPEQAYRLIALPPLWGFRARDAANALTKPMYERLGAQVDAARNHPDPTLRPTPDIIDAVDGSPYEPAIDPITELTEAKGDKFGIEREKQSALAKPAQAPTAEKHDEANILEVEHAMLKNLTDLETLVPLFRLGLGPVKDARARVQKRANEAATTCMSDPDSAYAFAESQRSLLKNITFGIANAATRLVAHGGALASDATREPLQAVAHAYLETLVALEVPELARPRIGVADGLALNIDIALQEAALHERLGELDAEFQESSAKSDPLVTPFQHSRDLDTFAMSLADARLGMRESPVATQAKLKTLKPQVDKLGFQIGLSEKLARLNMLWEVMHSEDDIWEGVPDAMENAKLRRQNRELYTAFKETVYDPYTKAEKAGDAPGMLAAQRAYNEILNGTLMKEHGKTVRNFIQQVAKHKKWSKFVVSLAITFVAFGLGQWEFGAVMAAEGTLFEAAIAGGLTTTLTTVTLNKLVFDQNPTAVNVLTSFAFNVGTFFVIGKMALAAKAAAAELAVAEGALEAKAVADVAAKTTTAGTVVKAVGKFAWGMTKEAVIAEAMGFGQASIEKALEKHELLNAEEVEDIFVQSLAGVVGMRVFHAMAPPDLFQYKTPEQKIANDIAWLRKEQASLQARAKEVGEAAQTAPRGKPDRASIMEVLERWKKYLEREEKTRQQLIEYAEKHTKKFSPEDIARLKAAGTDPVLLREMRTAQALVAIEAEGVNRFSCAPGSLDLVIEQHRSVGNDITKISTDAQTGQRTITVKPADGTPPFEITEKVQSKGKRTQARVAVGNARHFEAWLDARNLTQPAGHAELRDLYLRDPEAAINYAAEKYGYQSASFPDKGLVVAPDAPGEAGKLAKEPIVIPAERQIAAKLGYGSVAIGNGRFMASSVELADMHAAWSTAKDAKPSKIIYDPETNTSHFEIDVDGQRVRVEAQLASKVHSFKGMAGVENRVVGGKISEAMGMEILRGVVRGEHEMLHATGIAGELVKPGDTIEFGLGRLHDGKTVIVLGKAHEIDWSALPGIEPAAHTHPSSKGNNLLGDVHGREVVTLTELLDPTMTRHLNRHLIFPSAADFITMAQLAISGHVVLTPFVVENGVVRKPAVGENLPMLELTIGSGKQVGTLPTGERVIEATLEGKAGDQTPITNRKVWIIEGRTEATPSGSSRQADSFVELAEPPGLQRSAGGMPSKAPAKMKAELNPAMKKLAAHHGEDAVNWALASVAKESEVGPLVQINKPLRDQLMTIRASDARDLLAIVPEVELGKALTAGGPVTAEQLVRLRLQLGDAVAKDMIVSAVAANKMQGALERLGRIADGVVDAASRLPAAPLGTESIVLDSNARSALEDCQRAADKKGAPLATYGAVDSNYRDAINAIRLARGIKIAIPEATPLPMTMEQLVGTGADLRMPQVAGAEAVAGEALPGAKKSLTMPKLTGIQPDRAHPNYPKAVAELAAAEIGGPAGAPDRGILADVLFTESPTGSIPTFVTVDQLIYVRLARKFADPPITWPTTTSGSEPPFSEKLKLAPESKDGGFRVKVAGRLIYIRYK